MATAISFGTSIEINAPIERIWPLFSDTDRVNRLLGLPASEQIIPNPDFSRTIRGHFLGIPVSWREQPFEWVDQQWFEITRIFEAPFPVDHLITRTIFTPQPSGRTHIDVRVTQTARSPLGGQPARLFIEQKFLRDMRRVYRMLGEIAAEATDYIPPPPLRMPSVNTDRLERARARLIASGIRPALADKITTQISTADDPDVIKMRPFVLADRWNEPRLEVLRAFLYATRSGMLDLEWDVICPSCRGTSVRNPHLSDLASEAHCPTCQIRYDVDFEESVELRFSVSPDLRIAEDATFCAGGPANTRHILAQLWLEPGTTQPIDLTLVAGDYRVRSRQIADRALIRIAADATAGAHTPELEVNDHDILAPAEALVPGTTRLILRNSGPTRILLIIEQTAWNLQSASAALVTALNEFRQLFSSEVLAPGLGISIRNLTFLFSDLKDSTAIYDTIGDSPAYARVRDHFDVMRSIIGLHNGALVKTIGDAVMAVFRSSEDAIEAAIQIQREFNVGPIAQVNPTLRVKLGLHGGPCIAVNANELLDYFGSTVNIAARVQSESVGGDIVITEAVCDDPGVQRVLLREQMLIERFERSLKGFSRPFMLARLWAAIEQPV
jgi:class 3 adenylate cyclase